MTSFLQRKVTATHRNCYSLFFVLHKYFFTLRSNSLRGIITEWSHPSHLMRISIPIRIIFQRFSPHGWAFFISTTSYKLYCFCSILQTPLHIKSLFHSLTLHDYIKPYVDMEFQYHVNLGDF